LPHKDILEPSEGCYHALVRDANGKMLGGASFRLVQLSQPGDDSPPELLVLHVSRTVVAETAQRCGLGSCLVRYLRALLVTHASVRTMRALVVTQADNHAVDFWRKCGLEPRSGARLLVESLFRHSPADFPVCEGARPMLQLIATSSASAEPATPLKEAKGRVGRRAVTRSSSRRAF